MTTPGTLAALSVGARARVIEVGGDERLQQRLLELGVLPGIELKVVRTAPLGDPLEVQVMGYSLSLRRSEAEVVRIEALSE